MTHRGSLVMAGALFFTPAAWAEVPSQFIAKQYSEALGRAPDSGGWQTQTNYFLANGCSQSTLRTIAGNFFDGNEYLVKGYSPEEVVLTAYRAVLSREPDSVGFNHYVGLMRNSGWTPGQVARDQAVSAEFTNLVGAICGGGAYRQDWNGTQAINIGSGTWSQAQLQSCVNNNVICSVPPRVVVYLSSTLTIPAGHTLETLGLPGRLNYARQARLVRSSGSFGHLIALGAGATIRNIWVGGQRHLYRTLPTADGVRANLYYDGGSGGVIRGVRTDFPYQRTHMEISSAPGSITIQDNLLVNYTANHLPDGTWTWVSDGISNHNPNGTILDNHIIDPTDVGIVLFGHNGMVQASTAYSNTIVHAGNSAYGSLGLDTIVCSGCGFSGPGIHDNLILAGRKVHSDIMLFLGTGPWYAPTCPSGQGCGTGGRVNNNVTIWGDANQKIRVQHAVLVDGMLNANSQGNTVYVSPEPLGACYKGTGVTNDSPGHASGSLMLEGTGAAHNCIAH